MDGLSRAAGSGTDIVLDGKRYLITPLTFEDIGLIESKIIKDRKNPIVMVAESREFLPEDIFKFYMDQAYADAKKAIRCTEQEFNEYVESREGQIYVMWLCLLHKHPEVTLDFVINAVSEEVLDSLKREIEIGTGLDELGNSTGDRQAEKTEAVTSAATGGTSTDSSQESITGGQKS